MLIAQNRSNDVKHSDRAHYYHQGIAALIERDHIDTDQIIPKQFLTAVSRHGFGEALFYHWRYLANGEINPHFVLNHPPFDQSSLLIAGSNFGCGSSREHAPWALAQFGIKVIIASGFADIFRNNCIQNQMLAATVTTDDLKKLIATHKQYGHNVPYFIDLNKQQISLSDKLTISFTLDEAAKSRLLSGLDSIGITELYKNDVLSYEKNLPAWQQFHP